MSSPVCPCRTTPSKILQPNSPFENLSPKNTSLQLYSQCCQPIHFGMTSASTAEQLMHSRYSAFVLGLIDYIVNSTLPAQQAQLDKLAIKNWAEQKEWSGLEIVEHIPKLGKRHAQVEFIAYYDTPEGKGEHHEKSTFVKVKPKNTKNNTQNSQYQRWYFLDPTVVMKATQKQPCICGSGDKFKRCCGQYI